MIFKRIIKRIFNLENKYQHLHKVIPWEEMFSIHNIPIKSVSEIKIVSCYFDNIDEKIVEYQKKVFDKFKVPIEQHITTLTHGEFLTQFVKSNLETKYLIFFDIDCIPTSQYFLIKILQDICDENTLAGAIQTANHKQNGNNIYVGPFFMAFSSKLYQELEIETLEKNDNFDVGGVFTHLAIKNQKKVKFWFPTQVKTPKWFLYPNSYFGNETIYDGLIYHTFEIRFKKNKNKFIRMCKSIIKK
jgi:hypothetical protein